MDKLRTIDLFAGVGGIRIGFEKAGFETAYANDFDPFCKYTYDLNFKRVPLHVEDLQKISADDLPDFDVLLGGFPCQPFSVAGYRQGFKDRQGRGNLFFDIMRLIEAHKPRAVMLENVKNLKGHDKGKTFRIILEAFNENGYSVQAQVLNSMVHGNIPQNRERIFIVAFSDKQSAERFNFPTPLKLTKTVADILENSVPSNYYYEGKPLYPKLKDAVKNRDTVYQWRRVYVRENKRGVCPTLTANMGMGGHNVPIVFDGIGIRKLTLRECARLQGFPDSYKLPSNIADSQIYKQFGNSVTVPVVARVARAMRKAMEA